MITVPGTLAAGNYSFTIRAANKLDEDAYAEKTVSLQIVDPAKVAEAAEIARKVLEDFKATNATTQEDVIAAIRDAISETGATVDWGEVNNFVKTEATVDAAGSIHDYLMVYIGHKTVEIIEVSLVIPKLPDTDTPSGGTENPAGGLSAGAIAGIAIGCALLLLLVLYALGYFLLYKRDKLNGKFFDGLYLPMRKLFGDRTEEDENAEDKK